MIDLEDKKDFAPGIKSRNIYTPNQNKDFKISRSKFDDFRKCPRCFYCDVVKGYVAPGTPGWALNSKTDELLKKEFDKYREEEKPHPFFLKNNLGNIRRRKKDLTTGKNHAMFCLLVNIVLGS